MMNVALTPMSQEWEVAFFTSIQPELIAELSRNTPTLADSIFGSLDEDEILDIFTECCNRMNVSICEQDEARYQFVDGHGNNKKDEFTRVFRRAITRKIETNCETEVVEL